LNQVDTKPQARPWKGLWLSTSAVFAAQNGSAGFRADLATAQAELAALRANAPAKPEGCELEAAALAQKPY
jgi:hypothetical protein